MARCDVGADCRYSILERCNPWPHVANRHISIRRLTGYGTSFSLWDHSCVLRLRRSQPPFSLWRHSLLSWPCSALWTYVTYVRTDTLPCLIYKEYKDSLSLSNDVPVIACRWLVVHSVMGSLVLSLYIGVWWHLANSMVKCLLQKCHRACRPTMCYRSIYFYSPFS